MRRGEILGLRWGDIDWTASSVTVERAYVYVGKGRGHVYKATKTDEPRVIAIGPGLLERLQMRRWIADGTGAVIPDLAADPSGHTPRPVSWLSQAWAKHCRRHGSTARFHDLRHWHATVLLDEGTALATVQGRLGHSKATTTLNIYTHAVAASDIAAAALAEGLLELTTSTGEHHE
jgi:integrase